MGGNAFTSKEDGLFTPRMPFKVYSSVQSNCSELLGTFFTHVATPILAPAKKDHGDVDFVVVDPTASLQDPLSREKLSKALGAIRHKMPNPMEANFAVPWPTDSEDTDGICRRDEADGEPRRFVQIDVSICPDKTAWEYFRFEHAHGDMANMFASFTKELGLKSNTSGLYLCIEGMEKVERTRRVILLSQEPSKVLSFLGVDAERWMMPFDSVQALFEYVASSRFFSIDGVFRGDEGREPNRKDRRSWSREHFAMWIDKFIPECRAAGTYRRKLCTREQVRDEALQYFGVRDEFEERVATFRKDKQREEISKTIKASVPVVDAKMAAVRSAAIRGLTAIILEQESCYGIAPAEALQTEDGFYVMDEVDNFIQEHWLQVGQLEFQMQRARAATERQKLANEAPKEKEK